MSILAPIDSGGIMLSYKCICSCRHCLYGGGPNWDEWMDVQDAGRIFHGLLETSKGLHGFHLAGGEPFLDFERLLRIQKLATEFGVPIEYIETNAGWCSDDEMVWQRFDRLKDAGLRCVMISCSPFHAERISLDRVNRAVKVGREVFGPKGVIVWSPEFYRQLVEISTDRPVALEEYIESVGESMARYTVRSAYSLITGGRVGYQLGSLCERRPAERCKGDQCRPEILDSGHAHFDPYGNYIPSFCSGISLGDARELKELMRSFDLERLPIVKMLVEGGPYELYLYAAREFGYTPISDGYIGKCHLCVDVRKWISDHTDRFVELTPVNYYKQLTANEVCEERVRV